MVVGEGGGVSGEAGSAEIVGRVNTCSGAIGEGVSAYDAYHNPCDFIWCLTMMMRMPMSSLCLTMIRIHEFICF